MADGGQTGSHAGVGAGRADGIGRLLAHARTLAVLLLAIIGLAFSGSARAASGDAPVSLIESACVLASPVMLAPEAAARAVYDCDAKDIPNDTRQLWVQVSPASLNLPEEPMRLEGDSAPVSALHIVHRRPTGDMAARTVSAQMLRDSWTAGTRYSLPLTREEAASEALYIGADDPWSRLAVTSLDIIPAERAMTERFDRLILFAIYAGILLLPILYSAVFFAALRYRFMLFHMGMTAGFFVYTVSSSGLILHFLTGLDAWGRTLTSYASLSIALAFAGLFIIGFLEDHALGQRMRRAVLVTSGLLLANAAFIVLAGPSLPFVARNIYHAAYLPQILMFLGITIVAVRNGSRLIWFLVAGWSPSAVAAADRILRGLDIYILPAEMDFSLYLCLGIEVLLTACGIAYRVMALRHERDIAMAREEELSRLAETDGLTGLANRRAFDAKLVRMRAGALMIVDLDHFKQVNDRYGHQIGDNVLRQVGASLRVMEDEPWCHRAYRLGGEEFALFADARDPGEAMIIADRVRNGLAIDILGAVPELEAPVTASIGIAMLTGENAMIAYRAADAALYLAKSSGRNRAEIETALAERPERERRDPEKPRVIRFAI